jgi:restriction endonuclease Mrr
VTTSSFTADAVTEASAPKKEPVYLIDGEQLGDLLMATHIGVRALDSVVMWELDDTLRA